MLRLRTSCLNSILATLIFSAIVSSRLLTSPDQLTETDWDFVIVGGGTAGCVLASRLTEVSTFNVLLVEAGISNVGPDDMEIETPFLSGGLENSMFDWNFTTTPQTSLNNRNLGYPRGFVLGGSSSINFLAFTRGSSEEYDRLASVSGDPGWAWDNVFQYALKSERHVPSVDGHNSTGQFNPAVHGRGPLLTSLSSFTSNLDTRVINTTQELAGEFPFNLDMNSGKPLGIGWLQSTIGNGTRSSSATSYLSPVLDRPNLAVLIQTRVTRVIGGKGSSGVHIQGVEVAQSQNGPRFTFNASKEVVLSAGTIGTPHLLMLSGIGDEKTLSSVGINTLLSLSDVGQHLQEHPYFSLQWAVNSTNTIDNIIFNQTTFDNALVQWEVTHSGLMANNPASNTIGYLRIPQSSAILKEFGDPTAGPLSPHFEIDFCNEFVGTGQTSPTSGHFFSAAITLVSPTSVGAVSLTSDSVFDDPVINPNLLATVFDRQVMVEAVQALLRFIAAPAWHDYLLSPFGQTEDVVSSTDLSSAVIAYAQEWAIPVRHPVGTARISPADTSSGVVGPDLKVKGVSSLRVVDASVIPFAVGAHPQAEVYIIAERAADLIKAEHNIL